MSDVLQTKGADDRHMPWPPSSTLCGGRALEHINASVAMYFRKLEGVVNKHRVAIPEGRYEFNRGSIVPRRATFPSA